MRDKRFYITVIIFLGVMVVGAVVYAFLGAEKSSERLEDEEIIGEKVPIEVDGEDVWVDEEEKEMDDFLKGYELTESEKDTILKNRVIDVVEPVANEARLYIFYDREKTGSGALIDIAEDFIERESVEYTVYHMNNEDGLVSGQELIRSLGYDYDFYDEDGIVLIYVSDKEIKNVMTSETLNEKDLKR